MPTVVVTGAGTRVGAAIARAFLAGGYDLALHAHRSLDGARAIASEARAVARRAEVFAADLTAAAGQDALATAVAAAFPVVDVLVHNAAAFEKKPFPEITRADYERMRALNVDAPFFLTQALLPRLRAATDPCVVVVGDIAGERPIAGYAHYSVSKAGVLMLMRALAVELAPRVRVNAVSPGTVLFPDDFDEAARARVLARVPLARAGSPDDVANAVVWIAREGRYLTGVNLPVDGGRAAVH